MVFIKKHLTGILVCLLLAVMAGLMFFSALGDSNIVDEFAHIPAGFSYITTGDYRLNPEHPPLIKDLAAVPLVISGVKFPYSFWRANNPVINNQWETGWRFLYQMGNNPDLMNMLARIPVMLISLVFGYFVFRWANELYGEKAGIFAIVLFVFNTNIIAHSRYVTTDIGISAAFFVHMYSLYRYIKKPSWKTLAVAGFTFFIALVTKFSAAVLVPTYFIVFLMLTFKKGEKTNEKFLEKIGNKKWYHRAFSTLVSIAAIALIGVTLTWIFYFFHTVNMSAEVQRGLITESLGYGRVQDVMLSMNANPVLKPINQYILGFVMMASHVEGGHDAFLLGQVSNKGWWYYYPVTIALKTQIPIFIFMILSAVYFFWRKVERKDWFTEIYFWVLPLVLLAMGMQGSIDLGIRYMLPLYAFAFVSISKIATAFDLKQFKSLWKDVREKVTADYAKMTATILIVIFAGWYIISAFGTYPFYLSYFNEFVGGYQNGYKYLTDSNLDWGQDNKRLAKWVSDKDIDKIYVDVFPDPRPAKYYLGDRMIEWHVQNGNPKGYFALSATFYQSSRKWKGMGYSWLDGKKPIKNLGGSILIYYLK